MSLLDFLTTPSSLDEPDDDPDEDEPDESEDPDDEPDEDEPEVAASNVTPQVCSVRLSAAT